MKIAIYALPIGSEFGKERARYLAEAFSVGLEKHNVEFIHRSEYRGVEADVSVAYGWIHQAIFDAYRRNGNEYIYFDLGYWNRHPEMKLDGFYRFSVNDWDTSLNMERNYPSDRLNLFDVGFVDGNPSKEGNILIAEMSDKSAETHGFAYGGEWEAGILQQLKSFGRLAEARRRSRPDSTDLDVNSIDVDLAGARLLITHHSNAAVDALRLGVPVYAIKGVGRLASQTDFNRSTVDQPFYLSRRARRQLLADIAYAQWSPPEMRSGEAWDHMRHLLEAY